MLVSLNPLRSGTAISFGDATIADIKTIATMGSVTISAFIADTFAVGDGRQVSLGLKKADVDKANSSLNEKQHLVDVVSFILHLWKTKNHIFAKIWDEVWLLGAHLEKAFPEMSGGRKPKEPTKASPATVLADTDDKGNVAIVLLASLFGQLRSLDSETLERVSALTKDKVFACVALNEAALSEDLKQLVKGLLAFQDSILNWAVANTVKTPAGDFQKDKNPDHNHC